VEVQSPHSHSRTHFIKGGTPCDPACPPFQLALWGERSLHTLVLLRHGESRWNAENRYTGWCDVPLTGRGEAEAKAAGRLLHDNGIELDHAFTSVLKRASYTCHLALGSARQHWVPLTKSWRLNERHYGALQGYNKDAAYSELGYDQELVMRMRRSYRTRPPAMSDEHPYWHGSDRRYDRLSGAQKEASRAESLEDCADRIMPFFDGVVAPSLLAGNRCLVVSHANSIRALIKQLDRISDEDIKTMTIPTGIPMLYRLDGQLRPIDPTNEVDIKYMIEPRGYTWATSRTAGFHGVYLGDVQRLKDIQEKRDRTNRDWQKIILRNLFASALHKSRACASVQDLHDCDQNADKADAVATRSLWYEIHSKMQEPEFGNMLMLDAAADVLDKMVRSKKWGAAHLTAGAFNAIVSQLHLDTEGRVVAPFQEVCGAAARERRQATRMAKMESEMLQHSF